MLALVALALLWYYYPGRQPVTAVLSPDGFQQASVTIDGRYQPDTLRVEEGIPVRLRFIRNEDDPCSERVVFSAFGVDRRLPAFQETTVEFVPTKTGIFLFTCHMGMYRGRLMVTPSKQRSMPTEALAPEKQRQKPMSMNSFRLQQEPTDLLGKPGQKNTSNNMEGSVDS